MRGHPLLPTPIAAGHQSFATGVASARTAAGVGTQTRAVVVTCDQACHYVLGGAAVNATTNDTYLPANSEHYVRIAPGQYVAAIRATADGTFHVSEMDG